MYANTVEAGRVKSMVDPNRLFYTALAWGFHSFFQRIGLPIRSLDIFQGMSLFSSIGILILVYHWTKSRINSLLSGSIIASLALGSCWWKYSSDPHSHMVSLFFLMTSFVLWEKYLEKDDKLLLLGTGLAWYGAMVIHQAHVLAGVVFILTSRNKLRTFFFSLILGLLILMSYLFGLYLSGESLTGGHFLSFIVGKGNRGELYSPHPILLLITVKEALFGSNLPALIVFLSSLLFVRTRPIDNRFRITTIWLITYVFFFSFFDVGNFYFMVFLLLPYFLLYAQVIPTNLQKYAAVFLMGTLILYLPEAYSQQKFNSVPKNNPLIVQANSIWNVSEPRDVFIIVSGPSPAFKFYLTYFSRRFALPVDFLIETQQERGFLSIDGFIQAGLSNNAQIYFQNEALNSNCIAPPFQEAWRSYLNRWIFSESQIPGFQLGHQKKK